MEVANIVSQILAVKDDAQQMQFSTTALRATAIAGALGAAREGGASLARRSCAPGVGRNLDVTA